MDLRLLKYFAACVEHKNLHAAAEALHISQPALSKAIRNLETEFHVPLFERRPRGVVPTAYGLALLRYTKLVESDLRRAIAEIDAMRGATKGKINIGVVPTMIAPVSAAMRTVMKSHPGLMLAVRAGFSTELMTALLDGELDFAIILLPAGDSPLGFKFDRLFRTDPVVAVRANHPLTKRKNVNLQDLLEFPWLLPTYPPSHRRVVNQVFLDAGIPPPTPAMEVSTVVFFESLIRDTDMLTIMPTTILATGGRAPNPVALPIKFPFEPEWVGMGYRDTSFQLPGARIVMQCIKEICGAMRAGDR